MTGRGETGPVAVYGLDTPDHFGRETLDLELQTQHAVAEGRPSPKSSARDRSPDRSSPWSVGAILAGLVVASLLLHLEGLGQRLWMDEGISIGIASHRAAAIPGLMAKDGSPPLYYLVLHGWMAVFGRSEVATHALSLVLALAAVPVGLWAGWSLFGRRVGWITAVLLATCPFLGIYAGETRMYTLVVLLSLLATASYLHVFAFDRSGYLPLFVVSSAASLYTHNWAIYLALGLAIGLVPCLRGAARADGTAPRSPGKWRRAVLGFGAVGLAYLPWLPTLRAQAGHTGAPWSARPSARLAVSTVADLLGDPYERVLVILLLTAGIALVALLRGPVSPEQRGVAALAVTAAVILGAGWLVAQAKPAWSVRYLAVLFPAVVLLAATGLARSGAQGLVAMVLILLFWTQPLGRLTGAYQPPPRDDANDKQLAALVAPRLRPGDVVVAAQMEEVPVLRYYLGPAMRFADPTGVVADPTVADWRDASSRLAAAQPARWIGPLVEGLAPGAHVYLVCRAATDTPTLAWFVTMDARCADTRAALAAVASLSRQAVDFASVDDGGARVLALFEKSGGP